MLIRIPADYDQSKRVYIETFNINTDMMKNVRLRLEHALLGEMDQTGQLRIIPKLITEKPNDVWRQAFIGGSSLLLALFFGTTIIAANLFAFDRENRTRKEILLTPVHLSAAGVGIIISSLTISTIASLPALLIASTVFNMHIYSAGLLLTYITILPILVGCAGLGILAAQWLKSYRVIQPVIIVTSIATFFGAGGFAGAAVLPPAARQFAAVWLFSRIFEWYNPILHNFQQGLTINQYVMAVIAGVLGILLVIYAYNQELRGGLAGGQ